MQHAARLASRTIVRGTFQRFQTIETRRADILLCSSSVQHSCSRLCAVPVAREPLQSRSAYVSCSPTMVFVDLTLSDSDDDAALPKPAPAAAAYNPSADDADAAAKKRIMDFAASKAATKRTRPEDLDHMDATHAPIAAARQPSMNSSTARAAAEAASSKQRIIDFARAKAAAGTDGASVVGPGTTSASAAAATAAGEAGRGADDTVPSSAGGMSNLDLRALHEARMRRQQQQQQQQDPAAAGGSGPAADGNARRQAAATPATAAATQPASASAGVAAAGVGSPGTASGQKTVSLLTYNVWFKEEVAVLDRMMAIGNIIKQAGYPTFICLQEVTPYILELFINMEWWSHYHCCPAPVDAPYFTLLLIHKSAAGGVSSDSFKERPFYNSVMGRSLRSITGNVHGCPILVATSHLESPIPPANWYSKQRQEQMSESLKFLDAAGVGNVLFAGDMNWTDSRDGAPPLPLGWIDAWQKLQPGQPGFTYDSKSNPMLTFKGPGLRLDRWV
eukprot:GHUV01021568.1.p1 GENE.GHUV01021568.1~~GHUV01021568.1.p1  ORF type:complete len:505 (+),score=170.22 GHUV01021568.1:351-1865(+)